MEITITIKIDDEELKKLKTIFTEEKFKDEHSRYVKTFDDGCLCWTKDPEYNLLFLKTMQDYCNIKLSTKKHLLLNDVYGELGIPATKAGEMVGWVYDEKNQIGDNYVDFRIYDECNRDFINGSKNTALLDFNVDGDISTYLKKVKEGP